MVIGNPSFGRWGETFSDDVAAADLIDRRVRHAEVCTLTGDSYRTRARRELLAKGRTTDWPWWPACNEQPSYTVITAYSRGRTARGYVAPYAQAPV
jgi:hypothetical protein